jgi:hypothetical protein
MDNLFASSAAFETDILTEKYVPSMGFKRHLVLIDEADQLTAAAQLYMLSILDSTHSAAARYTLHPHGQ